MRANVNNLSHAGAACYNSTMKKHSNLSILLALCMALLLLLPGGCAGTTPLPQETETPASPVPVPSERETPSPAPVEKCGTALRVWLINTGESDSLLFQTESGAFLVDTGLKGRFDAVETVLARAGVSELDAVVLTHGHKDHMGGLKKLLKLCPVDTIYTAAVDDETYSEKELETIAESGAQHMVLGKGDSFTLCGISFAVLSPERKYAEELGEDDDSDADSYRTKIKALKLPEETEEKLLREVARFARQQPGSAEASVLRNYLDTVLELPWNKETKERLDVKAAAKILDEDHFGLETVKKRILETLAVRQLAPELPGQILCLVGPPGVGKTSVAISIARALNRKLARLSLGGVRDEAEIRGHRKTYIGAMPGRIMTALIQAKSKNALLLLDEIDKLGSDYKGDPSSALLEVLDSAQNSSFRDHYIEVPFDLSHCMFITTANTTDTIPRALLDRMEVIELGSYTDEEKLQIAKRHLLPKQLKKHGIKRTQVRVSDDAIREIIACYTRESGVRSLERQIAALCRKCAMRFVSDEPPKRISITGGNLEDFLGVRKFLPEANVTTDQVGLVTGLAWTAVGGTTLEVEVNVVDGSGKLELTGNLGDVMKESAFAAMSFIRSRAKALGLAPDFYKTKDIHVHFPEGAVPKDGPSAGITICTAIVSALTNRPVRRDVAMTGEISIRGRVLAIGGLKEKTMAALRHGVKTVIIPAENEKDLEEIDQTVRQALQFITVSSADRVLEAALLPAGDATETISVPAAPALPIPAPKTRRKPGIRQ